MEYRDMLHRYVGRRVCVSTFGHAKLWGDLAAVNDDSLRLVNTSMTTEGDDQWLSQSQYHDADSTYGLRHAETIVHFHHIVAITCLDEDLPEPDSVGATGYESAGDTRGGRSTGPRRAEEIQQIASDDVFQHLRMERLEVLVGVGLVSLADAKTENGLSDRLLNLRNVIGAQLGFILPPARIRDDVRFDDDEYRIYISGTEVARGVVRPGKLLAITRGTATTVLPGEHTFEPLFSQPAIWVEPLQRPAAEQAGYLLVEPAAVLAMHLQSEVKRHAHELFSVEGLRLQLEHLRQFSPAVVDELVPHRMSLSRLHDLLSRLLEEEVPLRPLECILERIAHLPPSENDVELLLAPLRVTLGRIVCDRFRNASGELPLAALDRDLSEKLEDILLGEPLSSSGLWLSRFIDGLRAWYFDQREAGRDVPLVVDSDVRRRLRQVIAHQIPGLAILAFAEVPHELPVNLAETLTAADLRMTQRVAPRKRAAKVKSPR